MIIFETMGTVVSLTGRDLPAAAEAELRAVCRGYDERFSTYRADSELSRLNERAILLPAASPQLRATYDLAVAWRERTDGAFTPHRPDGQIDLSGVVKALAIRDCGAALQRLGARDWCLNVGGDVLVDGTDPERDGPWVVGIVDPADRARLISRFVVDAGHPAVCTSGTSERGQHVWRLDQGDVLRQVTVAAADVVTADVLATAILAGGRGTLDRALATYPIEVLAIDADGNPLATSAFWDSPATAAVAAG